MIGNITKGNGFFGCTAYVLGKPDAQLINTNMAGGTPTQLAWEFRTIANFNHRVQKPVLHLSFSPALGDRTLDEWELCQIGQDLLNGLKLSNNQFILVQHSDAEYNGEPRPHAHMVINRVSSDGKCNDDYLDYYRTEKILRQIEQQYDLIIQPSSWSVERKNPYPKQRELEQQTGTTNIIQQLQTVILTAAADQPAMPLLVARLLKDDIKADVKYTRTGKVKGISYGIGEENFAGNDLGKVFTFNGLQKHLGVSYNHSRDKPVIESLQESFTRGRVIDDARVEHLQNWIWWREKEEMLTATGNEFRQFTAQEPLSKADNAMPRAVSYATIATAAPIEVPSPEIKKTQPQERTVPAALPDSVALPSIFEKLKLSINAAATDCPSMPEMIAKLNSTGVKVKVEFSAEGLATGISYERDGVSTNSSNLGERYSFEGLQNLGVEYNPEWDNQLIETIVDYGLEERSIDDSYIERLRGYRQAKQLEQQRMEQVFEVLGIKEGVPIAIAPVEPENTVIHTDLQPSIKAPLDNDITAAIPTSIGDRHETTAEDNKVLEEDTATESDVPQASIPQEYADKIAATIRLLWQRQRQPQRKASLREYSHRLTLQINGQHYDLELAGETLQVMRKDGEQIASVPLDSATASFQGFTQEDWDRFDKVDALLRTEHLRQKQQCQQSGVELD